MSDAAGAVATQAGTRSLPRGWKPEAIAELIVMGRGGASWAEIGERFYPYSNNRAGQSAACMMFSRVATSTDRAARRAELGLIDKVPRGWKPEAIAELITMARAGVTWVTIGARFYPCSSNRGGRAAASVMFSRVATSEDWAARWAALARSGRGGSPRKPRPPDPMIKNGPDPFAALGACFR